MKFQLHARSDAVKQLYQDHGSYHQGDAGLDLFFPEDVTIMPGETKLVSLQVSARCLDRSEIAVSYYLYPRSSIWKTPLRLSNSVGIIDAGYTGQLGVGLDHIRPEGSSYHIKRGDRLFQICAPDLSPVDFELVDELPATERGSNGFGSTGN
ncbi:MAG: dCTP deaminase/dUTPase family protein [Sulfobacillus sp.]